MVNIRNFCFLPDDPAALAPSFPFHDEGLLIATNGPLVLVLPVWDGPQRAAPQGLTGIATRLEAMPRTEPAVALDGLNLPTPRPCLCCQGVGRFLVEQCLGCDGLGRFNHGGLTYRCAVCAGRGEVFEPLSEAHEDGRRCWYCFGSGQQHQAVQLGPGLYEARHLQLLSQLPACSLQPAEGDTPARFTFDGGWGFLAPTVPDEDMRALSAAYEAGFARTTAIQAQETAAQG